MATNKIALFLVLCIIWSANSTDLLITKLASATFEATKLLLSDTESILWALKYNSQIEVYTITGNNVWSTSSVTDLDSDIIAYSTSSIAVVDFALHTASNTLFVVYSTGAVKALDISGRLTSWGTSSVNTDIISSYIKGSLTGSGAQTVYVSANGLFLFIGTATGLIAYDISGISSWTTSSPQSISSLTVFGSISGINAVSLSFTSDESVVFVAGGSSGLFAVNVAGQSAYTASGTTATFTQLGSATTWGSTVTNVNVSPDNNYLWVATSAHGYILSISGRNIWSSKDLTQLVVYAYASTTVEGASWINGANYLIADAAILFDLREIAQLTPGATANAANLSLQIIANSSLTQVYSYLENPSLNRLYVAASTGVQVLSLLTSQNFPITVCQTGYYFSGASCWACLAQCATCYSATTCSSCVGSQNQTYSRILSSSCQCPSGYYDDLINSAGTVNCQSGCQTGQIEIGTYCSLSTCLALDLSINFNDFQFSLTAGTENSQQSYSLWINYTGTLSPAIASCYQPQIYFIQSSGQLTLAPSTASSNTLTTTFLHQDLTNYGCILTTTATDFIYNCSLSYQAYYISLQQISLNFTIGISVNRQTSSVLSLGVNQLTDTQSCVSCNIQFNVSTSVQLVNSDGTARSNTTYNIGDSMIFLVQISDTSLRNLYYVEPISTTLSTGSLSFTVTPSSTISTVKGQLTVIATASLAVPSATITIIGQLSTTLSRRNLNTESQPTRQSPTPEIQAKPPTTLRVRMLQTEEQEPIVIESEPQTRLLTYSEEQNQPIPIKSGPHHRLLQSSENQYLRATYQVSIVDPSTSQNNQQSNTVTTTTAESTNYIVAIIIAATGVASAAMVAHFVYYNSCKDRKLPKKIRRRIQFDAERSDQSHHLDEEDEEDEIDEKPKLNMNLAQNKGNSAQMEEIN